MQCSEIDVSICWKSFSRSVKHKKLYAHCLVALNSPFRWHRKQLTSLNFPLLALFDSTEIVKWKFQNLSVIACTPSAIPCKHRYRGHLVKESLGENANSSLSQYFVKALYTACSKFTGRYMLSAQSTATGMSNSEMLTEPMGSNSAGIVCFNATRPDRLIRIDSLSASTSDWSFFS